MSGPSLTTHPIPEGSSRLRQALIACSIHKRSAGDDWIMRRGLLLVAFVATALVSVSASAQNWLVNGTFDVDTSGWETSLPSATAYGGYYAADGYGAPGAAEISVAFPGDGFAFTQCVAIAQQPLDLVFYAKYVLSGGGGSVVRGWVTYFSDANCQTNMGSTLFTSTETLAGGWVRHTLLNFSPSPGALSAAVVMDAMVISTSANVIYEDAGFGPTGTFYTPQVTRNRLLNPELAFDLSNWTEIGQHNGSSYTNWGDDAGYDGDSGLVWMMANHANDQAGIYQCVNIAAQPVDFDMYYKVISGGSGTAAGIAALTSFSEPDCAGESIDVQNPPVVAFEPNGWRRFSQHNYALLPATQSVKVSFSMAGSSNDSGTLQADHFFFGPADDTLFKNGFE